MKSGLRTRSGSTWTGTDRDAGPSAPLQTDDVRVANRWAILQAMADGDAASRATLAHRTGLSVPTVATILQEFVDEGFVRAGGLEDGTGGRPAQRFLLDPDARHVLAVDLSGHRALALRVDLLGRVVDRHVGIPLRPGLEADLVGWLRDLLADPRAPIVARVAVAVPGIVDPFDGHIDLAPALGWHDFALVDLLEGALGCATLLENDVNALALAELGYGVGAGAEHVVYVAIGSGIGAGLIVQGRLLRGAHAAAGEIGSSLTPEPARGAAGVDGAPLERDLMALASRFLTSEGHLDLSGPEARAAFERFADSVRCVVHNLSCALDPDLIVIAWPADEAGLLVDHVAARWTGPMPVRIVAGALGPGAAARGVARSALTVVQEELCRSIGRDAAAAPAVGPERTGARGTRRPAQDGTHA
jgi:predicted NBD/HSP70 family sugar kinase